MTEVTRSVSEGENTSMCATGYASGVLKGRSIEEDWRSQWHTAEHWRSDWHTNLTLSGG